MHSDSQKQGVDWQIRFFSFTFKVHVKFAMIEFEQKHKLKWHKTVKITIISHAVTLIPWVHNENGADEKN